MSLMGSVIGTLIFNLVNFRPYHQLIITWLIGTIGTILMILYHDSYAIICFGLFAAGFGISTCTVIHFTII
jgi:hypothetical protein